MKLMTLLDTRLHPATRLLALYLEATPGWKPQAEIAKALGISRKTVVYGMQELKQLGYTW